MTEDSDRPSVLFEVSAEVANALANEVVKTAAQLQGLDPMTAAVAGGAAGGTVKGVTTAALEMFRRRRDRGLAALAAAEHDSGLSPEELLERALTDDRKLDLLSRALESATRDADEQRVRFYGRIAASGVLAEDTATVDTAARVFSTIAALARPDLKVLLHVTADPEVTPWHLTRRHPQQVAPLDEELPELAELLDPILMTLETAGLVTSNFSPKSVGDRAVIVTSFGRRCRTELMRGEDAGR